MSSSHTLELPTNLSISKLKAPKTIHSFCSRKHFSIESEKSESQEILQDGGLYNSIIIMVLNTVFLFPNKYTLVKWILDQIYVYNDKCL